MIKCNIEVSEPTISYIKYVLNFPVLPEIGKVLTIKDIISREYEVIDIAFRAEVRDRHDAYETIAPMEIYIVVQELK